MKHCKGCGALYHEDWIWDAEYVNEIEEQIVGVGICPACDNEECSADCSFFSTPDCSDTEWGTNCQTLFFSAPHCSDTEWGTNCQTLEDSAICLIKQRIKENMSQFLSNASMHQHYEVFDAFLRS